jgi:apolipoprotein N-acyltransferase
LQFFYLGLSALAGAVAVTGWAPLGWWPLALIAFALLLWLVDAAQTITTALLTGLAFGLGLHGVGHGWMYSTLHARAGLGSLAAGGSMLLFLTYLAAFTAIPCGLYKWLSGRSTAALATSSWKGPVCFAGLLMLGEWARSLLFNGFTSLSLGYGLIDTVLAGYAPVAGLYGVGLAGFCVAGLLTRVMGSPRDRWPAWLGVFVLMLAGAALVRIDWVEPKGPTLSYRLIQSHVARGRVPDAASVADGTQRVMRAILQAPADIVATPETAFPAYLQQLPGDTMATLQQFAQSTGSHLFLGLTTFAANSDGHNSVVQIGPGTDTGVMAQYNKVRLMAFGEYSPAGFGWFTRALTVSMKDMSAGRLDQAPFSVIKQGVTQRIGTLICQEDLIGRDARRWADSAELLLNPSNLSWFDGALPMAQGLQIARMRALEAGRPLLRVATTGITAHVDMHGRVQEQLAPNREETLAGRIQPATGRTPYVSWGDGVAVALGGACVLLGWRRRPSSMAPRVRG